MSTTLLAGSLALAGLTYATVNAGVQGVAGSPAATPFPSSGVSVQVLPVLAPEKPAIRIAVHQEAAPPPVVSPRSGDVPNPQIVCGMKVWRADANIDPGIHMPLPDGAAGATIRRIPATECVEDVRTESQQVVVFGTKRITFAAAPARK